MDHGQDERGPVIVGWRELVDLPDWGITRLRAKLDTGARTSALHVTGVTPIGGDVVTFDIVRRRGSDRRVHARAPVVRTTRVRSSNGMTATRFVVRTRLRLGPVVREIEVTLVDRGAMIHRMLIGRSGLTGIVVDPSRRYVVSSLTKTAGKDRT